MAIDESRRHRPPRIVSQAEWRTARIALLTKEKELTAMKDALAAQRRALPWVRVEGWDFTWVSSYRNTFNFDFQCVHQRRRRSGLSYVLDLRPRRHGGGHGAVSRGGLRLRRAH
jgi:predicted dithiol-disulfide oxidoreductase (DUF899 family)